MEKKQKTTRVKTKVKSKHGKGTVTMFARIFSLTILCMLVPVILTSTIITTIASKNMANMAKEDLEYVSSAKLEGLANFIDAQKMMASSIVDGEYTKNSVSKYFAVKKFDSWMQTGMSDYLANIQESSGNLYENLFVSIDGQGYADCFNNTTLHDVSEEDFYIGCRDNGSYIGIGISPVTGNQVYVISYAIYDKKEQFAGAVNMSIDIKTMNQTVVNNGSSNVRILDLDGFIIASPLEEELLLSLPEIDQVMWEKMSGDEGGYFEHTNPATGEISYIGYSRNDAFVCEVDVSADEINKDKSELITIALAITIICVLIAAIVVFVFAKKLSKPLKTANKKVGNLINDINEGHGNLNTVIDVSSRDETGDLVRSINSFIKTLNEVISKVRDIASNVKDTSIDANNIISDASASSMNISAVMEELTASMEEVSASAEQMSVSMEEINNTSENVLVESQKGSELVVDIKKRALDVKGSTVASKTSIEATIVDKRQALNEAIEASNKVAEINNLTTEILNIASQTNLLALNASIEAARAGESGRGFAVVAGEIGHLANSSKDTANNIQELSNEILQVVSSLVEASNSMLDTIVEVVDEDYNGFVDVADNYYADAEKIDSMISAYTESMSGLQNTVDRVSSSIKSIASTISECTVGVSDAAENVNMLVNSMNSIKMGADDNLNGITELNDAISKFE